MLDGACFFAEESFWRLAGSGVESLLPICCLLDRALVCLGGVPLVPELLEEPLCLLDCDNFLEMVRDASYSF